MASNEFPTFRISDIQALPPVDSEFVLPDSRPKPGSLMYVLKNCTSLASSLLPGHASAVRAFRDAVAAAPSIPRSKEVESRTLETQVGLAVDSFAASHGDPSWFLNTMCRGMLIVGSVKHQLYGIVEEVDGWREPDLAQTADIARLWLAGQVDVARRGFSDGTQILATLRQVTSSEPSMGELEERLAALLHEDVSNEIRKLAEVVRWAQGDSAVNQRPVFKPWGLVRAADGDWIQDSMLVELKCLSAGPAARDVMQLLSYAALAEIEFLRSRRRKRHFDSLGLLLPRQSSFVTGTPDEWLAAFGGPSFSHFVVLLAEWLTNPRDASEARFLNSAKWAKYKSTALATVRVAS